MGIEVKADELQCSQWGQAPVDVTLDHIAADDRELIEITEDAYKQNNVYRPWLAGIAGQRKAT